MAKTKFKKKYAKGSSEAATGNKKKTRSDAAAPKASAAARPKPKKKAAQSNATWLRNTLLPKAKMDVQLGQLMETLHDREKLTDEDFKQVKASVVHQSYWLFALSAVWTGLSFYLVFEQKFDPMSATVQAAVGCAALLANLMGVLGAKFESDNLLTTYLSLMTCLVLVTLLVGGYGILSTEYNVRKYELALQRGSSLALSSTVTPDNLRLLSYVTGAVSVLQVPLQGYAVKNAGRMLTTMRAVTNFMETLTILMFPIGCMFIAGGVFIVQNLQDQTAAITALFIFAVGCGIISLAVLGYFGTTIRSRGMLLMFQWPVLLSIIVLFAFGVWATIQADVVKQELDTYWVDIRRFLPTTFEGRYDRVLFGDFISTYLQTIAFMCFYIGIFFLFCSFGAGLMRQEIKTEHAILKAAEKQLTISLQKEEVLREEMQSVRRLEVEGLSHSEAVQQTQQKYNANKQAHLKKFQRAHKSEIHKQWKKAWKNGDKFARCMTKIGCCSVCIVLIVVVACGLAFLVYASFCETLDSTCEKQYLTPKFKQPEFIRIANTYKRGVIVLGSGANKNAFGLIDTKVNDNSNGNKDVTLGMNSCSLDAGYEKGGFAITEESPHLNIAINAVADPQQFFGVDKSCQKAFVGVAIPENLLPVVNITSESNLKIAGSKTFALRELSLEGVNAAADINQLHITYTTRNDDPLHRAMNVNSDLGEVSVNGKCAKFSSSNIYDHGTASDAECDNTITCDYKSTLYPVPSVSFESINGFMTFSNAQLSQCNLNFISKDSAPTIIKNVITKCTTKHCQMNNVVDVKAQRGSVELTNVIADAIAVSTTQGRVQLTAVTQLNPETGVTITTERGNMQLDQLVASGNIQLESKQGNIVLKIPMCGQYPAYMGTFQIAHAAFQKTGYKEIFTPSNRVVTDVEWNDKTSALKLTTTERSMKSVLVHTNDVEKNIITGTIGCHLPTTGSICAYSNELLVTTETGQVTIEIDHCKDVCGTTTSPPPGCPR